MTILSREQAERILAAIPKPERCDLCKESEPRSPQAYGPFTVWLCPDCNSRWIVGKMKGTIK